MLLACLLALTTFFIETPTEKIKLNTSIAKTCLEREKGLQGVAELKEHNAMLFIFNEQGYYPFWMDKTKMPLAFLFLNSKYVIVDIKYGVPYSKKIIRGKHPYQYVLEVNPKLVLKYNIKNGDKVYQDKLNSLLN
ncbi:MAG: hypothetical protein S4CHLAM6_14200 [Chlamydiae bacterium]|nr:hypothetical protein [Chlamydiota bacterium]